MRRRLRRRYPLGWRGPGRINLAYTCALMDISESESKLHGMEATRCYTILSGIVVRVIIASQ